MPCNPKSKSVERVYEQCQYMSSISICISIWAHPQHCIPSSPGGPSPPTPPPPSPSLEASCSIAAAWGQGAAPGGRGRGGGYSDRCTSKHESLLLALLLWILLHDTPALMKKMRPQCRFFLGWDGVLASVVGEKAPRILVRVIVVAGEGGDRRGNKQLSFFWLFIGVYF